MTSCMMDLLHRQHGTLRDDGELVKYIIEKDGVFIKQYPPLGDIQRSIIHQIESVRISDHERNSYRNTRELHSAKCEGGTFAQGRTFEVIKSYQKQLGEKQHKMSPLQWNQQNCLCHSCVATKSMHFFSCGCKTL